MLQSFGTAEYKVRFINQKNDFMIVNINTGEQSDIYEKYKSDSLHCLRDCLKIKSDIFNASCKNLIKQ